MRHLLMVFALALLVCGVAAQPPVTPDANVMRLDEIGLYAVGYAYRGQTEHAFPIGWSGLFEEKTGIACQPAGEQNGRQAFLLHCPWRNGTGITYQQFQFRLPQAKHILLRGATAMRADIVGKSDGATFRVYANGRKLLDINRTDSLWQPFEFDLTPYTGRSLLLRFETDPGPKDNPSYDYSLWGDREVVLEGFKPTPIPHPDPPALNLTKLHALPATGVVPACGFAAARTSELKNGQATFDYRGADGELRYLWSAPSGDADGVFGRIELRAQMKGDRAIGVPLAGGARLDWGQPAQSIANRWQQRGESITLFRTFKVGDATSTLVITGKLIGKSLVFDVKCDRPLVRMLDAGAWGPVLRRRQVPTPYYTGQVYYFPAENLFVNAFLDWTAASASRYEGTLAHYDERTDGSRATLAERIVYTPAWHLAEALPDIPNRPSPYRKEIGDRIVLDIWGGRYTDIAQGLEHLSDYGITNCVAIIHDWQRSGYDNALPDHLPAAADKGGDAGMKTLVATGRRLGYRIALHENYVDYYPNYDLFNENDIALDAQGHKQLAWYNPGTKIQSFAVKPNAILRLAATQSPEIHRRYGTNADYLDVHSAVPPWFHVDLRAGEEGAGMFARIWDVHRKLWDYERQTHDGPVFGEGNNHWYWSGCLDGVEAQFGSGWPSNAGMSAPLMVDFDLLKIHPLQFNHGMGYYERWWGEPNWGSVPPMLVLDQYRMQEVAYGHAGFLGAATWNVLPLAWLEHHLLTPVMARYATAQPTAIRYLVNGRWVDGTAAAKAGDWRRVRVTYDNGLDIVANGANTALDIGGYTLPQFGWRAQGAGMTAWTALRDGVVADYAETANSVFANARPAAGWNVSGVRHIRPQVTAFTQVGPRAIRFTYAWQTQETLSQDYSVFVHFGKPGGAESTENILFQQDHALPMPTSLWKAGTTVADGPHTLTLPANLPDGDYDWKIGMFAPGAGRVPLEGLDDGNSRILLGVLRVRDGGKTITFIPELSTGTERQQLYALRLNNAGKVVDFGAIQTNGSVLIRREGNEWVLRPYPREQPFTLILSTARFGQPRSVRCIGAQPTTITPQPQGNRWRLPMNGAKEYRWTTTHQAASS